MGLVACKPINLIVLVGLLVMAIMLQPGMAPEGPLNIASQAPPDRSGGSRWRERTRGGTPLRGSWVGKSDGAGALVTAGLATP